MRAERVDSLRAKRGEQWACGHGNTLEKVMPFVYFWVQKLTFCQRRTWRPAPSFQHHREHQLPEHSKGENFFLPGKLNFPGLLCLPPMCESAHIKAPLWRLSFWKLLSASSQTILVPQIALCPSACPFPFLQIASNTLFFLCSQSHDYLLLPWVWML